MATNHEWTFAVGIHQSNRSRDLKGGSWPLEFSIHAQLAWPILTIRHFSDFDHALLFEAGAALNLTKNTAERLLENLRSRIVNVAEVLYAEVEQENARLVHKRSELSATLAGECRCLRTILHTMIKEMSKQIA